MFEEEVVSIGVKNQYKKSIENWQKIAAKRIRKTDKKTRQILTKIVKNMVKNLVQKRVYFLTDFCLIFGRFGDPKSFQKVK